MEPWRLNNGIPAGATMALLFCLWSPVTAEAASLELVVDDGSAPIVEAVASLHAVGRARCSLQGGPAVPIVARRYDAPPGPGGGFVDYAATAGTSASGAVDAANVLGYDGDKWAHHLAYHDQSVDDALQLFKWLRHKSYTLIKDLPESVWANTIHHSENGWMTFDDWLNVYERHIPEHIEQIDAIHAAWAAAGHVELK